MSEVTIADLRVGQERIAGEVKLVRNELQAAKETQVQNHSQNRKDIHDLRDIAQTAVDGLSEMRIKWAKMSGYAAGAGAVVAVIAHFIDKLWK